MNLLKMYFNKLYFIIYFIKIRMTWHVHSELNTAEQQANHMERVEIINTLRKVVQGREKSK